MSAPYQTSVVGCIQTIALADLPPDAYLHITSMFDWATYRWLVEPVTGVVNEGIEFIHEAQAAEAAESAVGKYDSGWWQSNTPGYSAGDTVASIDVYARAWWITRSLPVPVTRAGPATAFLPNSISLGYGCTGVRITSFVYFGAFDVDIGNLNFITSDASGLNLESLGGGYYQETLSGKIYRSSWLPPYSISKNVPGVLALDTIVSRLCKRGGLDTVDYDASDLSAVLVSGYPIATQTSAADCLLPLMQTFFGYASEYDAKLNFKFYGENSDVTINIDDLIEGNDANDGNIVSNLRNQATEFPRRIVGNYMDPAQNYSVVNTFAERQALDVIAIGDQTFAIPVVMSAADATKAVNKALKVAYATLEGTLEFSTPYADSDVYISVAAGEPFQLLGKRYVMDEMILSNGYLKMTGRYDRQSAYTSNVQPVLGNPPTVPTSPRSGPTTIIPMNLPSQRPQDTVGVYIAASSTDGRASWRGCTLQVSYDGMTSWQNAMTITRESTIGSVAAAGTTQNDPLEVATIKFDLESATPEQLAAKANAFSVLDNANNVQLGQFALASELTALRHFELTEMAWSLGVDAFVPPSIGDRFTLMDAAYFLPIDPGFLGRTIYFRGVGFGETADTAQIYSLIYLALVATVGTNLTTEAGDSFIDEAGLNILFTES